MQLQIEKPIQNKQFKVGIVGPSKPQWKNPEQYAMMQRWIKHLIKVYQTGHKPIILKEGETPYPSPCGFGIGEKVEGELIIVSGHCPVGKEGYFDITFNDWLPKHLMPTALEYAKEEGHKIVKVYDQGGVDTEVEIIATKLGVKIEIYPAPAKQWPDKIIPKCPDCGSLNIKDNITCNDCGYEYFIMDKHILKGYHSCNIQIAESNVVECLVPYQTGSVCSHHGRDLEGRKEHLNHPNNGGCWTRQYAQKLGKETHLVVIK